MTEDRKATFETIDSMQLRGDYEGLREIAQYTLDAIANDDEPLNIRIPGLADLVSGRTEANYEE
ncbi:MAG: hypothetical protein LUC93_05210 [Planctomycetaceae bacterium]|nr:hypothetical protein [Planctomycetaceae bacterium]